MYTKARSRSTFFFPILRAFSGPAPRTAARRTRTYGLGDAKGLEDGDGEGDGPPAEGDTAGPWAGEAPGLGSGVGMCATDARRSGGSCSMSGDTAGDHGVRRSMVTSL